MKAALLFAHNLVKIQDIERPTVGRKQVLVRVRICGIDGTALQIYRGIMTPRKKFPMILGDLISGDIEEVGSEVQNFQKGDRVHVSPVITCGTCYFCKHGRDNICENVKILGIDLDGGFAEFVAVDETAVCRLPSEISYEEAALLSGDVGTAYHAVMRARIAMGDSVAIFGAGGVGINAIQAASKLRGGNVIAVDVMDERLALANKLGAAYIVNSKREDPEERIWQLTDGRGVDVAMEFVGSPATMRQAVNSVRRGGRVVIVGASNETFSMPIKRLYREEVEVVGSYSDSNGIELPILVQLVRNRKIDLSPFILQKESLENLSYAFEMVEKGLRGSFRVLIQI